MDQMHSEFVMTESCYSLSYCLLRERQMGLAQWRATDQLLTSHSYCRFWEAEVGEVGHWRLSSAAVQGQATRSGFQKNPNPQTDHPLSVSMDQLIQNSAKENSSLEELKGLRTDRTLLLILRQRLQKQSLMMQKDPLRKGQMRSQTQESSALRMDPLKHERKRIDE